MPYDLIYLIVGVVAKTDDGTEMVQLHALTLSCKPLKRVADRHVKVLTCPETLPRTYSNLTWRWPNAVRLNVSCVDDAALVMQLRPIANLSITEPKRTVDLRRLGAFDDLKRLEIEGSLLGFMHKQATPVRLAALQQLEVLHVRWSRLTNMRAITECHMLKELDLRANDNIIDINLITNLRLERLDILGDGVCSNMESISAIVSLKSLDFCLFRRPDIDFISTLTNLRELTIRGCEKLADIRGIATLTNLHTLSLFDCASLSNIESIGLLTGLRALTISPGSHNL